MNFTILFHLFPNDIVYYIYTIIKRENSANYIKNYVLNRKEKLICLRIIILELFSDQTINSEKKILLFENHNFYSIKVLHTNNFRFTRSFWIHTLNILSFKLNLIRNHIHINNLNNKNHYDYIKYKNFYSYWFRLCKSYNIRLLVIKKPKFNSENYENLFIASRKLNKLKSEIHLFMFPSVLDDNYNQISIEDSQNYLLNY